MNTEFIVKLTPKVDRAVQGQSLPIQLHLKEDVIVRLAVRHNYGIITVLSFSKHASPTFAQRKPNGKLLLLAESRKSTPWLQLIILLIFTQSALRQMQHNTWQESLYSASLIDPKLVTVCRWRTNRQWKWLHSFLPAEFFPTKDLHKVSAQVCLPFQVSCASTWTQLLRLTNVLNIWLILELQPIMLRILHWIFGQSSSAFAIRDWNWHLKSAVLESHKLNS